MGPCRASGWGGTVCRYLLAYPQIGKSGLTNKTRCCQVKYHCIIQTVGKCRDRVCSWLTDPSFFRAQLAPLDSTWHGLGLQSICGLRRSSRPIFLGLDNSISPCIEREFILGSCCLADVFVQAGDRPEPGGHKQYPPQGLSMCGHWRFRTFLPLGLLCCIS